MIIAIVLLLGVVSLQIYFAVKTNREIQKLSFLFPPNVLESGEVTYKIEGTEIKLESGNKQKLISLIKHKNVFSEGFSSIIKSTNHYLRTNSGTTAEYNILRDIAERISESEESKINASVSLPLYIGLMGTFVGVIFGIIYLLYGFTDNGLISVQTGISEGGIHDFLRGVFIAMTGSFLGLLLTTLNNNYFFKIAKGKRDDLKNKYFNFLQAELLPTLENTLSYNIKEFKNHLQNFNNEFSDNIEDFSGTIPKITENMRLQTEFIKRFNDLDIPKLVNANLRIMDRLDESVSIFDSFNQYAINLNKSFETSDIIFAKITNLLDRIGRFEENINGVGELVRQSHQNYGKLGEYIAGNLTELQKRWQLVQEFVNKSENKVRDIAFTYEEGFQGLIQKLQRELSDAFSFSKEEFPFSKLNLLDSVNTNLDAILKKLEKPPDSGQSKESEIIEVLQSIRSEIRKLRKTIRPSIFQPLQLFYFIFSKNEHLTEI
jgi:hypothetical protein